MTDQKRARAERVEDVLSEFAASRLSYEAATEHLDAIYRVSVAGGSMTVPSGLIEEGRALVASPPSGSDSPSQLSEGGRERTSEAARGEPGNAGLSGPSESRLRKAAQRVLDCGPCSDSDCCETAMENDAARKELARALSATPESNDNQGGMDDG